MCVCACVLACVCGVCSVFSCVLVCMYSLHAMVTAKISNSYCMVNYAVYCSSPKGMKHPKASAIKSQCIVDHTITYLLFAPICA